MLSKEWLPGVIFSDTAPLTSYFITLACGHCVQHLIGLTGKTSQPVRTDDFPDYPPLSGEAVVVEVDSAWL